MTRLVLQKPLLSRYRRLHSSLLTSNNTPRAFISSQTFFRKFQTQSDSFYRRFLDRHQRHLVHNLDHNQLQPNIQHYLVELYLTSIEMPCNFTPSFIPSPFYPQNVYPVAFYGILSSLQLSQHVYNPQKLENLKMVYRRLTGDEYQSTDSYGHIARTLDVANQELFEVSMACLEHLGCARDDVIPWINSILASSVTEACFELTHLRNIPGTVMADILLRQPLTKLELNLQLDLWRQFILQICHVYYHQPTMLRTIVGCILYHTCRLDLEKLPELMSHSIQFLKSTYFGADFSIVTDRYLNELLWDVAYFALESDPVKGKPFLALMQTQQFLAQHITKFPQLQLSLEGHMGIVFAVSMYSKAKAKELMEKSIAKHPPQLAVTYRETNSFNVVRITLAETPQDLVRTFNDIARPSGTVWAEFVKKLRELGLLSVLRCIDIINELWQHKESLLITKATMLNLLTPYTTADHMNRLLANIPLELAQKFLTMLTEKYMTVLYQGGDQEFNPQYLATLVPEIIYGGDSGGSGDGSGGGGLMVARQLYSQCQRKRFSPGIIGQMLEGELQIQPQNIYKLFKEEIKQRELSPNEKCLLSLLKAARRGPEPFIWDGMYAPQIAIHEFKTYIGEIPSSDFLWQEYIELLSQYDYVDEMSEIIKWWEQLGFSPSPETLMRLLRALPEEFAKRHIIHGHKVGGVHAWPWPDLAEFDSHHL